MFKSLSNNSQAKAKKQVKHSVSKTNIWKVLCHQAKEGMWIPNKQLASIVLKKEDVLLKDKLYLNKTHTTKIFTLYRDYLMISNSPSKKPHSGMRLSYVKCTWSQDNLQFKIVF